MKIRILGFVALALSTALVLSRCGSSSSHPTYNYGGPGSAYTATLNANGTFTVTHAPSVGAAVDVTVTGTYVRLASGFVKLTIGSITGSVGSNGPAVGDIAYGMEIPGFAFLLKPMGSGAGDHIIPMVATGSCPTGTLNMNWIVGEKSDSSDATQTTEDHFGTFTYDSTSATGNLPAKYALQGNTSLGAGTVNGLAACSSGILSFTGGNIWLTTLGGALVHASGSGDTSDQIIIAMPQSTLTAASLTGVYTGLVFDKANSSNDRIIPVGATFSNSSGTLTATGAKVTDVDAGTLSTTDTAAISLPASGMNVPSNGFWTGTITINSLSGAIVCMAADNVASSGKDMMFCIAQSPTATPQNSTIFNVLLVTK